MAQSLSKVSSGWPVPSHPYKPPIPPHGAPPPCHHLCPSATHGQWGTLLPRSPTHRNSPRGASAASQPHGHRADVPLSTPFCSVVGLLVLLPKASRPCGPPLTPRPGVTPVLCPIQSRTPQTCVHFIRPLPLQLTFDSDPSSLLSTPP